MWLPVVAVCSSVATHLEADVPAAGGDYVDVAFDVPAGTQEIRVAHSDGSATDILDWGVWSPDGFRGWGGGLTDDAVIGIDQSSRGYLPGPIAPGTWTLVVGKAQLDGDGGHYSVDVTCSTTATLPVLPRAPFSPIVVHPERRWYRGDFHVHSEQSGDSVATLDQIVALARQRGLDFVNLSDHNTVAQHALQAAYLQAHPELLILRGDEITTYAGHGNAVGLHAYVDHRIGYRGRTIDGVLADVAAQDALFIVNHPRLDLGAVCIGCAWRHADTDWSKVSGIEVITGNWSLGVGAFVPQVLAMWDGLLDQGHRIAAIGGSDDHTAGRNEGPTGSPIGSPTTRVLADNLSEAAIIDAIRHGRTIVQLRGPDDPVVDAVMRAPSGGSAEIGDDVDGVERAELAIHVTGGAGTFAELWRNGAMIGEPHPVTGDDVTLTLDDAPGAGDFRYRVELINDANQRLVVTSHFFVHAIAAGSGCGCGASGDPASAALLAIALPWIARRRRRRQRCPGNTAHQAAPGR
jgi:MYXO-CTERM domain-containing protein